MSTDERMKLADELKAYASQYSSDWVAATITVSWERLNLIVAALRAPETGVYIQGLTNIEIEGCTFYGDPNAWPPQPAQLRAPAPEADAGALAMRDPLIKGAVYSSTEGPAEYRGLDTFYGETTHHFQVAGRPRYIQQQLVSQFLAAPSAAGIRR